MTPLMTFPLRLPKKYHISLSSQGSQGPQGSVLPSASRRTLLSPDGAIGALMPRRWPFFGGGTGCERRTHLARRSELSVARRAVMEAQVSITGHPIGREIPAGRRPHHRGHRCDLGRFRPDFPCIPGGGLKTCSNRGITEQGARRFGRGTFQRPLRARYGGQVWRS